jgi:iron complex outermembrane receptor protein
MALLTAGWMATPAAAAEGMTSNAAEPEKEADATAASADADIVVTAQKRGELLQSVPIAISAFGSEALERSNIDSVSQLQNFTPSLHFGRQDGQALITIRGIGTTVLTAGADAGVAVHLDGVYVARTQAQDAVMFDLERVEVLRGPQGTVNGRNATGGSINLISRQPTDAFEGHASLTVGNYAAIKTEAGLGGPLIGDKVMWRVAFRTDNHKGYTPNIASPTGDRVDDANQQSVRGLLLFRLGDSSELLLTADYDRVDSNGFGSMVHRTASGVPIPGSPPGIISVGRSISADTPTFYGREIFGATAKLKVDAGPFTVTGITGYRKLDDHILNDVDGVNLPLVEADLLTPQWQLSQEINLTSNNDGPFTWLLGAYYFHEMQRPDLRFNTPVAQLRLGGTVKTDSYALYAQATYELTERLRITAGARYSVDHKRATEFVTFPPLDLSDTHNDEWDAITPKLSIDYEIAERVMAYATISRGFRSGGVNIGAIQGTTFDPEFVWNYEAGLKGQFFDGRLQANFAGFYYDYTDLQLFQIRSLTPTVENAAAATVKGLELELVARPTDGMRLDLATSYLDATFGEFVTIEAPRPQDGPRDLAGNRLPRSPKWKVNAGIENRWNAFGGGITLRGEMAYTSKVFFNEFNRTETSQSAVTLFNARLTYETDDGRYRVGAFVENLTDKYYISQMSVGAAIVSFPIQEFAGPPRTYGLTVGVKF